MADKRRNISYRRKIKKANMRKQAKYENHARKRIGEEEEEEKMKS